LLSGSRWETGRALPWFDRMPGGRRLDWFQRLDGIGHRVNMRRSVPQQPPRIRTPSAAAFPREKREIFR